MTLSGDTAFIAYGIFKELNISNIHVLRGLADEEGSNTLIKSDYSSEGSATDVLKNFKNILFEESTLTVMIISKPDVTTNIDQVFSITNLTYKNVVTQLSLECLKLYKMTTVGLYSIIMQDIVFTNLTFGKESKLMYFQQQLENDVVVTNLTITDIVNAGVTVEAYDSNEFNNNTYVSFTKVKAKNIDGYERSLLNIYRGAHIDLTDSEFSFIGNYAKGAVVSAGKERALAVFTNCDFWNNTSVDGGVFESQAQSTIKCYNCSIHDNFAIIGGVAKANADGILEFYNSTIWNNLALSGAVAELFSSQSQSIVNNCSITSNIAKTKDQLNTEILPQGYIYQTFRDFLTQNAYLLEAEDKASCFNFISSQVSFMDNSFVGQKYVVYAVNSRVAVQNSIFQNTMLESKLLIISESDITLTNNSFSNLTCPSQENEILYLVKAYTEINTLNYTGSDCQLINSGLSQVDMKKMNVKDITLQQKNLITLLTIFRI